MSDDPIQDTQLGIVEGLLGRKLTGLEFEGFLILGPRFVDRFGASRIGELGRIFRTERPEGRHALAASLGQVASTLGSYDLFARDYPVTIVPPRPSYPLFPIIGIETFRETVVRTFDRRRQNALAHIKTTGRLPLLPKPSEPVLREKPRGHWCAYELWPTPEETRRALQILPAWSDCEARAILETRAVTDLAFVAYSVEPNDPGTRGLTFHGYFYEGVTRDHDEMAYEGDAVQICVYGDPAVAYLEEWDADERRWRRTWEDVQSPLCVGL